MCTILPAKSSLYNEMFSFFPPLQNDANLIYTCHDVFLMLEAIYIQNGYWSSH